MNLDHTLNEIETGIVNNAISVIEDAVVSEGINKVCIAEYTNQDDFESFSDMYPHISVYSESNKILAAIRNGVKIDVHSVPFDRQGYLSFLKETELNHSSSSVSAWASLQG